MKIQLEVKNSVYYLELVRQSFVELENKGYPVSKAADLPLGFNNALLYEAVKKGNPSLKDEEIKEVVDAIYNEYEETSIYEALNALTSAVFTSTESKKKIVINK